MKQKTQEQLPLKEGAFKLSPVVFDEVSFKREGFRNTNKDVQTKFELSYASNELEGQNYCITVRAQASRENEYIATVQVSGYITFSDDMLNEKMKETLLKKNAISILFPYVRSEMTLLTAQPEVEPIVWPVMNVLAMFEESEKNKKKEAATAE